MRALSLREPQAKVHRVSPSGRHASQELWARGAVQMAAPPCQPRVAAGGLGQVARLKPQWSLTAALVLSVAPGAPPANDVV